MQKTNAWLTGTDRSEVALGFSEGMASGSDDASTCQPRWGPHILAPAQESLTVHSTSGSLFRLDNSRAS